MDTDSPDMQRLIDRELYCHDHAWAANWALDECTDPTRHATLTQRRQQAIQELLDLGFPQPGLAHTRSLRFGVYRDGSVGAVIAKTKRIRFADPHPILTAITDPDARDDAGLYVATHREHQRLKAIRETLRRHYPEVEALEDPEPIEPPTEARTWAQWAEVGTRGIEALAPTQGPTPDSPPPQTAA